MNSDTVNFKVGGYIYCPDSETVMVIEQVHTFNLVCTEFDDAITSSNVYLAKSVLIVHLERKKIYYIDPIDCADSFENFQKKIFEIKLKHKYGNDYGL